MNVIEKMLAEGLPTIVADAQGLIIEVSELFLETYNWCLNRHVAAEYESKDRAFLTCENSVIPTP